MGTNGVNCKQSPTVSAVDILKGRFPDLEMNSLFCARKFPVRRNQEGFLSSGIYGEISLEMAMLGLFLGSIPCFFPVKQGISGIIAVIELS